MARPQLVICWGILSLVDAMEEAGVPKTCSHCTKAPVWGFRVHETITVARSHSYNKKDLAYEKMKNSLLSFLICWDILSLADAME